MVIIKEKKYEIPSHTERLKLCGNHITYIVIYMYIQKWKNESSKLVSIIWKCSEQNYQQTIDVTGTDLSRLRQQWESAAAEQCWQMTM